MNRDTRGLGPAAAEAVKRLSSRRSQMELALCGEHARSVLEEMGCVHCEPFLWEKLRSCSSLFLRELGRSSAPRGSGPAAAEAVKRLSIVVIANGARVTSSREEFFISTAADESRLREEDVLSVNTSSDPAGSASQLVCPAMWSIANYADIEGRREHAHAPMPRGALASPKKKKKVERTECARLPLVKRVLLLKPPLSRAPSLAVSRLWQ